MTYVMNVPVACYLCEELKGVILVPETEAIPCLLFKCNSCIILEAEEKAMNKIEAEERNVNNNRRTS